MVKLANWAAIGGAIFLAVASGPAHAFVCVAPASWPETGPVHEFYPLGDGAVLGAEQGVFRIDAAGGAPKRIPGPSSGAVLEMQVLRGGSAIFRAERGLFGIDAAARHADPVRGPTTGALGTVEALDGGALIVAEKGLFEVAAGMGSLDPVSSSGVAGPYKVHALRRGTALVAAQGDVFRLRAADSGLRRLEGPSPGEVRRFYPLQDGGVLLQASHGLFYADAEGSRLAAAAPLQLGSVREIVPLDGGGALIRTDRILFRIETATDGLRQLGTGLERPLDPESWSPGRIRVLASGAPLPPGTALIGTDAGAFIVDLDAGRLRPVGGALGGSVSAIAVLPDGSALVAAGEGLFRLRLAPPEVAPAGGPPIGAVAEMYPLRDGVVLIEAGAGLFRRDPAGRVTGIAAADFGLRRVHQLQYGALLESGRGLFYLDADGAAAKPVAGARIDAIEAMRPTAAGGALMIAGGRLFQFDRAALRIAPLAAPDRGLSFRRYAPLADGTVLISDGHGNAGLAVPDFADADVRLGNLTAIDNRRPGGAPVEARWILEHRCAPVASRLGLVVLAQPAGAPASGAKAAAAGSLALRIPVSRVEEGATMAALSAAVALPASGEWSLQLVATGSGVDQPIGAPAVVSVGNGILNWFKP